VTDRAAAVAATILWAVADAIRHRPQGEPIEPAIAHARRRVEDLLREEFAHVEHDVRAEYVAD
jgi:hypothetical protein